MNKIKPCPFCGSGNVEANPFSGRARCWDCYAEGPFTDRDNTAEWNRVYDIVARSTWQPIETAPSDGAWIICTAIGSVNVWISPANGHYGGSEPTHWMPLPKPPVKEFLTTEEAPG